MYHEPPQRLLRFLRWFCDDNFLEEIEGDLYELFQEEVDTFGLRKARSRFFGNTIRYIRPYFFGKKELCLCERIRSSKSKETICLECNPFLQAGNPKSPMRHRAAGQALLGHRFQVP